MNESVRVKMLVAKSCPMLCDSMDSGLLGSSGNGTLQARIYEWFAISSSKGSSQPGDLTKFTNLGSSALWVDSLSSEPPRKPNNE